MKRLYLIGGPMGVGKTTVCRMLKRELPACVFLDGDWCWDMDPFQVTEETKKMVLENITFLLNQFLRCSAYENIVFCWVMHQQDILDAILGNLEPGDWEAQAFSLVCSPEELTRRLLRDVEEGIRTADVIPRSLERLGCYEGLDTCHIDVTGLTPEETARLVVQKHSRTGIDNKNAGLPRKEEKENHGKLQGLH